MSMTKTERVEAKTLKAGDMITEIDTPDGPFYPVVKVNAKSIVVDAAEEWDDTPLPVRLPIAAGTLVLRVA
jgi:hypothetical protein